MQKGGREGRREGGREGGRKEGREGGREEGREGGREGIKESKITKQREQNNKAKRAKAYGNAS